MEDAEVLERVGLVIKQKRKGKGLTQKELGEKLGISAPAMTKYEQGQNLTLATLLKIAQALDTSITDILDGL